MPWPNPAPRIVKVELVAADAWETSTSSASDVRRASFLIGALTVATGVWNNRKTMSLRKASDLFVECLEAEGVKHVFGIPGEETLDLNESLSRSSIEFVPVRHEQGGAYMADVWGRLTGRAGVCLGTLGPGALNLVTAVADAFLDRAPLVALTGQGDLERMHKESHQYIDLLRVMRPITKWNARVSDAAIIPEVVRKAFKLAEGEKPGATHIELPEDVMAADVDAEPLPRRRQVQPEPAARELLKAADLIRGAISPVALAGNGVVRGRAAPALREFVRATGIPVAETFMGKGLLSPDSPKALGTVGLQSGDYTMAGFDEADLVLAIGYDLVEHSPEHWNPKRDKTVIRSEEHTSELQSPDHLVCRLLLEKKKKNNTLTLIITIQNLIIKKYYCIIYH